MAVTSLWRVKGYVGKVVLYVMNEKKTTEKEVVETGHDDTDPATALDDLVAYTQRDEATNQKQFVKGYRCFKDTVTNDMMEVKKHFGKTDGVVAYHGYQSFAEGEVTPEIAHAIGQKMAQELWSGRYQVLVTTHLDKDSHIHNHFVINTVSWVDGKKFHRTKQDYLQMRQVSDRLCREYGLSVIDKPKGHRKQYAQWRAEQNGEYTKDTIIKRDIDECVELSLTEKQFYQEMAKRGYRFNFEHKYATVFHSGFPKARRLKNLGEEYTPNAIRARISRNHKLKKLILPQQDDPELLFFDGNRNDANVFGSYRSVLVHYVCGFTVVRSRPNENRELMRLLSDELRKFDRRVEEQNLMLDHDLYSDDDIDRYKQELQNEMTELADARRILQNALKRAVRAENVDEQIELRSDISTLTQRIGKVRKEIRICERLLADEPVVEQKLREVQDYTEKIKRKEREKNEHVRGRGGTGRSDVTGRR